MYTGKTIHVRLIWPFAYKSVLFFISYSTVMIVVLKALDIELKVPTDGFAEALEKRSAKIIHALSTRYRVEFPGDLPSPTQTVFEAARECGAQVRVFSHAQRTLEDAFLEAVR